MPVLEINNVALVAFIHIQRRTVLYIDCTAENHYIHAPTVWNRHQCAENNNNRNI